MRVLRRFWLLSYSYHSYNRYTPINKCYELFGLIT